MMILFEKLVKRAEFPLVFLINKNIEGGPE